MAHSLKDFWQLEFYDIVPILKGSSNWNLWKLCMQLALRIQHPSLSDIMTGIEPRPLDLLEATEEIIDLVAIASGATFVTSFVKAVKARKKLQAEWDRRNMLVLGYIDDSIDTSLSKYVSMTQTSAEVYTSLRNVCETNETIPTTSVKTVTWQYWRRTKSEASVIKWRQLVAEIQDAYPPNEHVPYHHAFHIFLYAIINDKACQPWLRKKWVDTWGLRQILEYLHEYFIATGTCCLAGNTNS